jgi:uncharacterized membrane protein YedE/YeeE
MNKLAALLAGIIFGAGLVVSGMTNPDKVQAFLTLNSNWDISLIFVMGSALITASIGYAISNRRAAPMFAERFHAPGATVIDQPLLVGSGLFGVGWAFSGFCPGPAIVGAFTLDARALLFLLAYLAGVLLFEQTQASTASRPAAADG